MASIIPDNDDTAMRIADEDNITVAGLIFDAGTHNSKYLLQVGTKNQIKIIAIIQHCLQIYSSVLEEQH